MARDLILVRHAMPEVIRGVSSKLWRLSDGSREHCVLLADALSGELASPVISSGRPKVDDTAAVLALRRGLAVQTDERVAEVDQGSVWYDGDYRGRAADYLDGIDMPGWEARELVARRFAAAVNERLAEPGAADLVVVNHGLAMSLYLASLLPEVVVDNRRDAFHLVQFWQDLTFPDAWRLDLEQNTLTRLFYGGLTGT